MAGTAGGPLLSEDLYKQTVAFDYVVKRHVKLYSDRFETYADIAVPDDHRTFQLDDTARLQPDQKDAIQQKKRYLRPPGVGSMTALAAVRGKGAQLELVRLHYRGPYRGPISLFSSILSASGARGCYAKIACPAPGWRASKRAPA
jgi:hypothetical protein